MTNEELLQRIERAKRKDAKSLSLSCYPLSKLPSEITKLSQLQYLSLNHNHLREIPKKISQLSQLQYLYPNSNLLPIPLEILNKTEQPKTIIDYYFSERKQPGQTHLI